MIFIGSSVKAQTIDYNLIQSVISQPDTAAMASLRKLGYTPNKDGDFRFIADNKIKALISYAKANPDAGQQASYWAFQARGKKAYNPIFKEIKKGAVITSGNHFGKARTEYKSPEGYYFYPFEDSMFDGLYWIYVSRESLLDKE